MKLLSVLSRATLLLALFAAPAFAASQPAAEQGVDKAVRDAFAARAKEAKTAAAVAGKDGWLFLTSELRFLSFGKFWDDAAPKVSRAPKADLADPLVAIVDFQKQLKARGVELLLVPVPPKAGIHSDKILTDVAADEKATLAALHRFYQELTSAGVEVLDLSPQLAALCQSPEPNAAPYCKTDTHWSPAGCQAAAKTIAAAVQKKLGPPPAANPFVASASGVAYELEGDLGSLLPKGTAKPPKETIQLRQITNQSTGKGVEPNPASPVLLMGDSHTLVFHEFAGERAGLLDQLALELGAAPDLIGTRGSGSTAVRISLYRKSIKDHGYLATKKVVVWCFTAREFTESDQGWAKVPVSK
jgi:alginate O-acetyltransferase complex protein AlgJ